VSEALSQDLATLRALFVMGDEPQSRQFFVKVMQLDQRVSKMESVA
jgi:hypothetical protein